MTRMLGALGAERSAGRQGGATVQLRLMGRMQAFDTLGRSILPRNRKSCALLAILAIQRGRTWSRLELTNLLWSQRKPELARASLRQCLHELQERFRINAPNLLVAERSVLSLRVAEFETDIPNDCGDVSPDPHSRTAQEFEATLDSGALLLEDLTGLDEAFSAWLTVERRRLLEKSVLMTEAALAAVPSNAPDVMLKAAERLLRRRPTHQVAWRALMSAHSRLGQHELAARSFERCAAALVRGNEGAPSVETRTLAERLRAVGGAPAEFASISERPRPANQSSDNAIRLGVMPLRPLNPVSADTGEVAFCAGLGEEITTALSRFRGFLLVASSSLFSFVNASQEAGARYDLLRREFGLDFLLDGTVQRTGDQVRVTVRLLDLRAADGRPHGIGGTGEIVWTRRFDRPGMDMLLLQDEIAAETVAQVDPAVMRRAAHPPGSQTTALGSVTGRMEVASSHELMLRAIPALYRMEESSYRSAGEALALAITRSPDYAAPHAWLACWQVFLVGQGWAADADAAMEYARQLADRAVSLDPSDARGLTISGHVRAFDRSSIGEALALHERAIRLNPNLPLAWASSGLSHCYAGEHESAVAQIQQAFRLSPFDPHGFFFDTALSLPLLLLGRREESLAACRRAITINPTFSSVYKTYLSALGQASERPGTAEWRDDCARVRDRLVRLEPDFTVATALARSPLRSENDRDRYIEGLRRGGLRES